MYTDRVINTSKSLLSQTSTSFPNFKIGKTRFYRWQPVGGYSRSEWAIIIIDALKKLKCTEHFCETILFYHLFLAIFRISFSSPYSVFRTRRKIDIPFKNTLFPETTREPIVNKL